MIFFQGGAGWRCSYRVRDAKNQFWTNFCLMFWTELGMQIAFGVACAGVLFRTSVSPENPNCFAEMISSGTLTLL